MPEKPPYIRVKDFDYLQHYKNRNPPWIKLYNLLLDHYEFSILPDQSKWHVVASMLLASRTDNLIHNDPRWIEKRIGANSKVDVEALISSTFFEYCDDASNPLAECLQDAIARRGEERRGEGEENGDFDLASFNEFWSIYPKKIGKGDAKKWWKKNRPGEALVQKMLRAVAAQSETDQWKRDGGKYVPNPATWLNQERWEDDPETFPKGNPRQERIPLVSTTESYVSRPKGG